MIPRMPKDRVLVAPTNKRTSTGGILLPNSVRGAGALEGTIIAVGPECEITTKIGKFISFAPYSKYVVPTEEGKWKNHLIMNEEDILIIWELEEGEKDNG